MANAKGDSLNMNTFNTLKINPLILRALNEMGIEKPTPIQVQTLPILIGEPTDFLGIAATGTGKTVAFGVPLLEKIVSTTRSVQGLILCPTRELALQVSGQIDLLAKYMNSRTLVIYGGAPYPEQLRGLKQSPQIVVGTPGRIVDHINRRSLDLSALRTLILDEADEMISMGFKDDLETILAQVQGKTRDNCQIWLFCATMGKEIRRVADDYLRKPKQIEVNREERVPDAIAQIYYRTHEHDKPEIVTKLIDAATDFYGIIFCQTKSLVMDLTHYLKGRGYAVDCLHGDMDQKARERAMKGFRDRHASILVCTDVASRGLDVKDITHVINYSLPREMEYYVHRIGRTARSGKTGFALNLVTPSHQGLISRIEHFTKSKMRLGTLPTRKDIGIKKITSILNLFLEQTTFGRAIDLLDDDWKNALAKMSKEEIVGRFLSLKFPEIFHQQPQPAPLREPGLTSQSQRSSRHQPEWKKRQQSNQKPNRFKKRRRAQ